MLINNNESLFLKAKKSKKLGNIIWTPILAEIMIEFGGFFGWIAAIILFKFFTTLGLNTNDNKLLILFLDLSGFLFISLVVFFRVKFIEKRDISDLGLNKENSIRNYLKGFLLGSVMMCTIAFILYILGYATLETNSIQNVGISAITSILIILPGWIIQSASEEIVARGWLMNILGAKYNGLVGLIVSSIYFGLIHLFNPNINVLAIVNIILSGFTFGLYVIYTGNLWGACGLHAAWNFMQGNIFGFEVSGLDTSVGTLIDLKLKDNSIVSGGVFGPEAGLVATFIEIIVIIGFIYLIRKNKMKKV
ncbi:CPBP family intramembrane metalloprotease [Clostridium senegalense]|uniref:CPBP family intramembrane glutamic endopeptidase n=1 Tax=Clostridium senegalense TaxID=1465809 RepID=UPI001C10432D|nr:type II CAAX endopeptidase family protein [Clostridium senegalense]MBU5227088.1 CPBP family intramembrane metalloprotease [Clostridium senegalense]